MNEYAGVVDVPFGAKNCPFTVVILLLTSKPDASVYVKKSFPDTSVPV